ncbi:right-handed parallel beta-helix repeat-containing protein [bacterium]|nr:right-handed parallel beta-helix repeat-containing protein [bacterium]
MSRRVYLFALLLLFAMTSVVPAANIFNYQGHLKKDGANYTGTADFYFAIYRKDGPTETFLWVNDGGDLGTLPPTGAVPVTVEDGQFSLDIGDTTLTNMSALPSTLFNEQAHLFMRVWVDAGEGIEQLNPDRAIHLGPGFGYESEDGLVIYVDDASGNDMYSGLTPGRAKKTIQAAVDALPPVLTGETIIQIADGTYTETVLMFGILISGDSASLTVQKDPSTTGDVILHPSSVRAIRVDGCATNRIKFVDITVQGSGTGAGIVTYGSTVGLYGCTFGNLANGIFADRGSDFLIIDCTVDDNTIGMNFQNGTYAIVKNSIVDHTTQNAIKIMYSSTVELYDTTAQNSGMSGIYTDSSRVHLWDCVLNNNGTAGTGHGLYCFSNAFATTSRMTSSNNNGAGVCAQRGGYVLLGEAPINITGNNYGLQGLSRGTIEYYSGRVIFSGNGTNQQTSSDGMIIVN